MKPPVAPETILDWFLEHGRDLPWRRTREPWPILVAELMLQQTQVSRVLDRWPRFLERFPDPSSCAAAGAAAVIDEWSGLGYNRRAVALHRAAVMMTEKHGGCVPERLEGLLALPGIGPYTARAVRVFAFESDDGVLDTNVARILARLANRPLRGPEAQRWADELVPTGRSWAWNQAMLDVGAAHCRARNPICPGCPFEAACGWASAGRALPDPAVGSAKVSGGQSRFDGSDRQGRGRLVRALRAGPVTALELAGVMGWPDDPMRAERVAASLEADGLVERNGTQLRLPRG